MSYSQNCGACGAHYSHVSFRHIECSKCEGANWMCAKCEKKYEAIGKKAEPPVTKEEVLATYVCGNCYGPEESATHVKGSELPEPENISSFRPFSSKKRALDCAEEVQPDSSQGPQKKQKVPSKDGETQNRKSEHIAPTKESCQSLSSSSAPSSIDEEKKEKEEEEVEDPPIHFYAFLSEADDEQTMHMIFWPGANGQSKTVVSKFEDVENKPKRLEGLWNLFHACARDADTGYKVKNPNPRTLDRFEKTFGWNPKNENGGELEDYSHAFGRPMVFSGLFHVINLGSIG